MSRQMRHLIEIQSQSGTLNDFGEESDSWPTVTTRYVSVEPLAGRELSYAREIQADITHRVKFRFDDELELGAKDRILWGSKYLYLLSPPVPTEDGRYLMCDCKEVE